MKTQVMLDLETLGHKPGSVIVAVGAVKFGDCQILETFYERVDAESCVAIGLKLDAATVLWWMKQSDAARKELLLPAQPIGYVLGKFSAWLGSGEVEVWGNGASFDNVLLADAYDRAGYPRPWKYFNDRCYRTVKAMHPKVPLLRSGTHHNALDDARTQATHLMQIWVTTGHD
jgi:hypothetical protein